MKPSINGKFLVDCVRSSVFRPFFEFVDKAVEGGSLMT